MEPIGAGKRALVVLSGGQDSTTCLFLALSLGYEVHVITFNYGQRHARELAASRSVRQLAERQFGTSIPYELIVLGQGVLASTSPLIDEDVVLEQYKDFNSLPGGLEKTFVPMRNQLFLTIAFNRAVCIGATHIFTGVAQEDFGGYPDCRRGFIRDLEITSNEGLGYDRDGGPYIEIETPLMKLSKAETVRLATELSGCYEALAYSHTAYDGAYPPTGKDHATLLRAKGFHEAGIPDPLILRAWLAKDIETLPEGPEYDQDRIRVWTPGIAKLMGTEVLRGL